MNILMDRRSFILKKVTWEDVLADFKKRHPTLRREVAYWSPYAFDEILIYVKDGRRLVYNYSDRRARILKGTWLHIKK